MFSFCFVQHTHTHTLSHFALERFFLVKRLLLLLPVLLDVNDDYRVEGFLSKIPAFLLFIASISIPDFFNNAFRFQVNHKVNDKGSFMRFHRGRRLRIVDENFLCKFDFARIISA